MAPFCRSIRTTDQDIDRRTTICLLDVPFVAPADTGAGISFIGDVVFELYKTRKAILSSSCTLPQLASKSLLDAAGAIRLRISFNGKKSISAFLYLPGLTLFIILDQDFIAGEIFCSTLLLAATG